MPLADFFDDTKYQLMHLEMFPYGIIHAECLGGEIDLIVNRRVTIGMFPWRFVDGESSISRCVAIVDDAEYASLMAKKAAMPKTKFGDAFEPSHVDRINVLTKANME
jgi:arylformamidase